MPHEHHHPERPLSERHTELYEQFQSDPNAYLSPDALAINHILGVESAVTAEETYRQAFRAQTGGNFDPTDPDKRSDLGAAGFSDLAGAAFKNVGRSRPEDQGPPYDFSEEEAAARQLEQHADISPDMAVGSPEWLAKRAVKDAKLGLSTPPGAETRKPLDGKQDGAFIDIALNLQDVDDLGELSLQAFERTHHKAQRQEARNAARQERRAKIARRMGRILGRRPKNE